MAWPRSSAPSPMERSRRWHQEPAGTAQLRLSLLGFSSSLSWHLFNVLVHLGSLGVSPWLSWWRDLRLPQREPNFSSQQEEDGKICRRLGSVRHLRSTILSGIANLGTALWLGMAESLHMQLLGSPAPSFCRAGVAAPSLAHPGAASTNQLRSWPSLASLSGDPFQVILVR